MAERSEQNNADIVLVQILHHALESAGELEHLACHNVGKAGYAADTVAEGENLAGLEYVYIAVDLLKLLLDSVGDRSHLTVALAGVVFNILAEPVERVGKRSVINCIAHLHTHAAYNIGIDLIVA